MKKQILLVLLIFAAFGLCGCGKIRVGDAAALPGFGETFARSTEAEPRPKFRNGDIVRYKMLEDMRGIMMQCDYKYIPRLKTYYCIVDFYPSSAMHLDFSKFDNYERRYVYEYELMRESKELVREIRRGKIPARWSWMDGLVN